MFIVHSSLQKTCIIIYNRYEIIAKLENLGPFHIFFTLTSGDLRCTRIH